MTDRQKFWLRVLMAATVPVWVPVYCLLWLIGGIGLMFWEIAGGITDPKPPRCSGKRAP